MVLTMDRASVNVPDVGTMARSFNRICNMETNMEAEQETIALVGEFHRAFGIRELTEPGIPDHQTVMIRSQLIGEETSELTKALAEKNPVEVLDALCDLNYVIDGTTRCYGFDLIMPRELDKLQRTIHGISKLDVNCRIAANLYDSLAQLMHETADKRLRGIEHSLFQLYGALDLAFYVYGLDEIRMDAFREVHRSNMTKLGPDGKPVIHPSGRVMKGPYFQPPDLQQFFCSGWSRKHS